MINKKTKNNSIAIAITNVLDQPGATFPESEFNGCNRSPNFVLKDIIKI